MAAFSLIALNPDVTYKRLEMTGIANHTLKLLPQFITDATALKNLPDEQAN